MNALRPRRMVILSCLVFALVACALVYLHPALFVDVEEDIAYLLAPSPERAFAIGERHFNGSDPALYDIDRASYFFEQAARVEPNLPYLYHERARIAFLRGDFQSALTLINAQIALEGESEPNSYYVRGLIEGYMQKYDAAAKDYEQFLKTDPNNWAAINDYSWVLLKANRAKDAFYATSQGLKTFPDNPWLLNSNAIALYEMGDLKDAKLVAARAVLMSKKVTVADWLHAYPGNDPKVAEQGVETFKQATEVNMHSIISTTTAPALQ